MSDLEWMKMFGENLKDIMKEVGITQRELADETGLTEACISYYVNGQRMPSVKAIINIGYALNCSEDDLISFMDKIE